MSLGTVIVSNKNINTNVTIKQQFVFGVKYCYCAAIITAGYHVDIQS